MYEDCIPFAPVYIALNFVCHFSIITTGLILTGINMFLRPNFSLSAGRDKQVLLRTAKNIFMPKNMNLLLL